jgi:hypothetical protein
VSTNLKKEWTREINIGVCEYERLKDKAEQMDADIEDVITWLIEEYLDELL